MSKITANFSEHEFRCRCCGKLLLSPEFLYFVGMLQNARDYAGIPFVLTSGYRCEAHNKAVGGVADSAHLKAIAADIRTGTSRERALILFGLIKAGFERFGIGKGFIHVDNDASKPENVIWLY